MLHGGARPSALRATFRAICHRESAPLDGGEGEMKREPRCAHPGTDHSAGAMLHGGCVQGGATFAWQVGYYPPLLSSVR